MTNPLFDKLMADLHEAMQEMMKMRASVSGPVHMHITLTDSEDACFKCQGKAEKNPPTPPSSTIKDSSINNININKDNKREEKNKLIASILVEGDVELYKKSKRKLTPAERTLIEERLGLDKKN